MTVPVAADRDRDRVRVELVVRVRARRPQLEEAIFARIRESAASPAGSGDAEYAAGLRLAVAAAVDYALEGIQGGQDAEEPIPPEVLAQAGRAARVGVGLETVLRRYMIGSEVIGDFLIREARGEDLADRGETLREMLNAKGTVLDRLLDAITLEYAREIEHIVRSPDERRTERVRRLLAGDDADAAKLAYPLEGWHLGAIATGPTAATTLQRGAGNLGVNLLCVSRGEQAAWGWLGSTRPLAPRDVDRAFATPPEPAANPPEPKALLALGEPARGLAGWRTTHLQAQAALRVALHRPRSLTRYADVALLALALNDEALAGSLIDIYLAPLGSREGDGAILRDTLRAYLGAEHNASAAASKLGVTRQTVQKRLRKIEDRVGHAISTRQAELEVALRLEELAQRSDAQRAPDGQ